MVVECCHNNPVLQKNEHTGILLTYKYTQHTQLTRVDESKSIHLKCNFFAFSSTSAEYLRKIWILNFPKGSVATCLRWGGYCRMGFIANFIRYPAVRKIENRLRFYKVTESAKVGTFLMYKIAALKMGKNFAKSSITQRWIVWFCWNSLQTLITWHVQRQVLKVKVAAWNYCACNAWPSVGVWWYSVCVVGWVWELGLAKENTKVVTHYYIQFQQTLVIVTTTTKLATISSSLYRPSLA